MQIQFKIGDKLVIPSQFFAALGRNDIVALKKGSRDRLVISNEQIKDLKTVLKANFSEDDSVTLTKALTRADYVWEL